MNYSDFNDLLAVGIALNLSFTLFKQIKDAAQNIVLQQVQNREKSWRASHYESLEDVEKAMQNTRSKLETYDSRNDLITFIFSFAAMGSAVLCGYYLWMGSAFPNDAVGSYFVWFAPLIAFGPFLLSSIITGIIWWRAESNIKASMNHYEQMFATPSEKEAIKQILMSGRIDKAP